MRIAIDARKLRDYGIGTYVRNLLRHLSRIDSSTEYVLLCNGEDCGSLEALGENFRTVSDKSAPYSIREQLSVPLDLRRERYVDWVSGACLLVQRGAAEQAGLLDERYFLYTEDVDFCAAIRRQGQRVLFAPAAEIVHLRGRSRATAPAAMDAAYRRSHLAFYDKHHPRWAPLLRFYLRLKGQLPG